MKMQKKTYRIGEISKKLEIKNFVLRFWEKELNLKPKRSSGGQRFYNETDFEKFKKIKELLYNKKYTIKGAQQEILNYSKSSTFSASKKEVVEKNNNNLSKFKINLLLFKNKLEQFKDFLNTL